MKPVIILVLSLALCPFRVPAQERSSLLLDLQGRWTFSIGENSRWISPDFNDSKWETIRVPGNWEDQGFNGYNGYAFYRKKVTVPADLKGRNLYLNLGYIDDVDEVYINGRKIGSTGRFPPYYSTAYNASRKYYLPEDLIRFGGVNTIAVKVYDSNGPGGIVSGNIGIYGERTSAVMEFNLQRQWKFITGDNPDYKDPGFDDSKWDKIFVPARWEDQGYRNYDGYAWYRISFSFKGETKDMVLLMGKIDDIDQVYVNGRLIGSTGDFRARQGSNPDVDDEYDDFRAYYIPDGLLKTKGVNVIAVRVFDERGAGGIYEGPAGIMKENRYYEYIRRHGGQRD